MLRAYVQTNNFQGAIRDKKYKMSAEQNKIPNNYYISQEDNKDGWVTVAQRSIIGGNQAN